MCEQTSHFCQEAWCSGRARRGKLGKGLCWWDPIFKLITVLQLLLAEAERTVVLQYLRALMQGRLVCRGTDERSQAAERLRQDAAQLKELFLGLLIAHWEGRQSRISVVLF